MLGRKTRRSNTSFSSSLHLAKTKRTEPGCLFLLFLLPPDDKAGGQTCNSRVESTRNLGKDTITTELQPLREATLGQCFHRRLLGTYWHCWHEFGYQCSLVAGGQCWIWTPTPYLCLWSAIVRLSQWECLQAVQPSPVETKAIKSEFKFAI